MSGLRFDRAAAPPAPAPPAMAPVLRRKCACGGTPGSGGECEACRRKRVGLQRSAAAAGPAVAPPSVREVLAGPGRALEAGARGEMEARFGHAFGHVRVHDDARAADSARAVGAHAYTVGRHVVFAAGRYAPESAEGRRLLAHELAHVVQQRGAGGALQPRLEVGPVDAPEEREADAAAEAAFRGEPARVSSGGGAALRRAPERREGVPLPYREATELAACMSAMGPGGRSRCRNEVLGEPLEEPRVDAIQVVTGTTGAVAGFPLTDTGDLSVPGPWNNPTTGGVSNVHQVHFHLDRGDSEVLTARREIQRSAWRAGVEDRNPADIPVPGQPGMVTPGGYNGVVVGPDGPAAHEVERPSLDRIVVADAPGVISLAAAEYPYEYRAHFETTVAAGGADIASVLYDVHIEKKSATDVPNTANTLTVVSKTDLARNRALP